MAFTRKEEGEEFVNGGNIYFKGKVVFLFT
jgi:hypothetical protein